MRIFQLCLMTLAVCTMAHDEEFNWQGCGKFGLPINSEIGCSSASGCSIVCVEGYELSNGASYLDPICQNGLWKYLGSTHLPQCQPASVVCDIKSIDFDGEHFCSSQNSCVLFCNPEDEGVTHTCSYSTGLWLPPIRNCYPECNTVGLSDWYFPKGSLVQCRSDTGCKLTCQDGHQLSNGAAHLDLKCEDDLWIYSHRIEGGIPKCEGICDIESVFDGGYSCSYRNSQYTCDLYCSKGEVEVTHTCSLTTGIWSPHITKCKPAASKCDIESVDFDGGYSCSYSNIGYSCDLWCTNKENAATHICDHSTGIWSPTISKCRQDLSKCKKDLVGYDGGYSCYYDNSQYICDLYCIKGEDTVSHTCSLSTGEWSPPITKCKPANSKCDIESVDFNGGYSCSYSNIGYSCDLWCTNKDDAATHICDHSTGIWSPPITKCKQDLRKCKKDLIGYDGGYSCYYSNSQYICDLYCIKGEDTITHTCSLSTGTWSPPIIKCNPANSKCDIRSVFNGGASCSYSNLGYSCDIYCTNEEDAVTHTCSHSTGIWSPPITKCKPQEFNWNGCTTKGLIEGSSIRCSSDSGCEVTCLTGYQFSNGADHIKLECHHGHWTYLGGRLENLPGPRCQAVCSPSCRNGGKCLNPGYCQCTDDFTGPLCQYPRSNCDIKSSGHNGSGYSCSLNNKQYRCDMWCTNRKYAITHTCTYSTGRWSPPIRKCIW